MVIGDPPSKAKVTSTLREHRRRLVAAIRDDNVAMTRRALHKFYDREHGALATLCETEFRRTHVRFLMEGCIMAGCNDKFATYDELRDEILRTRGVFGIDEKDATKIVRACDDMRGYVAAPRESLLIGVNRRLNDIFPENCFDIRRFAIDVDATAPGEDAAAPKVRSGSGGAREPSPVLRGGQHSAVAKSVEVARDPVEVASAPKGRSGAVGAEEATVDVTAEGEEEATLDVPVQVGDDTSVPA